MKKISLPKPISNRALAKEYLNLAVNTEYRLDYNNEKGKALIDLFHKYLEAFNNLYGYMYIHFIWDVFCDYEKEMVEKLNVKEEDFLLLTDVIRVENNPYYVLDVDEVFDEEEEASIEERLFVNKKLVRTNATLSLFRFYTIYNIENQRDRDIQPYVPSKQELFSYLDDNYFDKTPEAYAMKSFLNKLKVSGDSKLLDYYNEPMATRRLKNIVYLEDWKKYYVENSKQEWRRKKYIEEYVKPLADDFFEMIKIRILYGSEDATSLNNTITHILNRLQKLDVVLDEKNINEFLGLYMNLSNNSHLWSLLGWAPSDLARERYNPNVVPMIQFGSNMQKMFENGELDKDELVKQIKELGLNVYNDEEEKKKWS